MTTTVIFPRNDLEALLHPDLTLTITGGGMEGARGAGRPLREEHPENCPHLSQFPSGPADIVKHHQGQRGEYGSHSILITGAGTTNLGETV